MRNAILIISSAAKTATSGKFGAVLKSTLFAVLLAAASMAGAVPIPGTPVPITLQTFVVMLAALMLPWKQAGAAVLMYLAAGAAGLPVFAGGASTMALVGPSAGFLIGFLPAAVVTSLLKGKARVDSPKHAALTAARYLFACVAGCIVLDYLLGFIVQSAITGVATAGGGHRFDGLHCGRLHQGGCGFAGRERTGKAAVTSIGSDFSAVVFYDFLLGIFS